MTGRIFAVALLAGLAAGLVISVVQEFTTTPIIIHAEKFEGSGDQAGKALFSGTRPLAEGRGSMGQNVRKMSGYAPVDLDARGLLGKPLTAELRNFRALDTKGASDARLYLVHGAEKHGEGGESWGPNDGLERTIYTALANVLTAIGFALVLTALMYMRGRPVDGRTGVLWGIAGFCVVSLAPSLGLPPELPGSMAADVTERQTWWAFASTATAAGLWLLFLGAKKWMPYLGIALLVLPHAVGAPHPDEIGGAVPPELAAHFVSASLVTAAMFWAGLGWAVGLLAQRFKLIQRA